MVVGEQDEMAGSNGFADMHGVRAAGVSVVVKVSRYVGKCSEAYYLERNSAMDDSIGGS